MKNPSVAAAGLLGVIALAVGGFVWLTRGDEPAVPEVIAPEVAATQPTFLNLSPREQRKKANLERTVRELEKIKQVGEEVMPGEYKVTDENGTTWYHGELIKGIGRNGEPLYMTASYKLRAPVPLRQRAKVPTPKLATKRGKILLGNEGGAERVKGTTGSTGTDGSGGADGGGSGASSSGAGAKGGPKGN